MKTTRELEHRIRSAKTPDVLSSPGFEPLDLTACLRRILEEHSITVGEAIQRCNLDRSYGYQLFNGTRRPTRDMLLTLSIHLGLAEEEVQRLLKLAGRPVLYARNRRDAAILYCLSHRLPPAEAEELLHGLEVDSLAGDL